jgi:S1-C subfamily serine protease
MARIRPASASAWLAAACLVASAGARSAVVTPLQPLIDLQAVADRVHSLTVEVRSRAFVSNGRSGEGLRVAEAVSVASGVLLGDGLVVTSLSSVAVPRSDGQLEPAPEIEVTIDGVGTLPARLVAGDLASDVAVVRLPEQARALSGATLADDDPAAGETVIAIGIEGDAVRVVAISVDRVEPNGSRDRLYTDRALPPPFAGGPLFDTAGHLAGVNTASAADASLAAPVSVLRALLLRMHAPSGI